MYSEKHHMTKIGPCLDGGVWGESRYLLEYAFSAHYHPFWGLTERVCPEDSKYVSLTPMLLSVPTCSPLGSYPAPPRGPPRYVARAGFT